jgi:hypothetical protein
LRLAPQTAGVVAAEAIRIDVCCSTEGPESAVATLFHLRSSAVKPNADPW